MIAGTALFRGAEAVHRLLSPDVIALAFGEGGDDAYYYFTVARNVARGHGITVDGTHWTSGFQPLWAAICSLAFMVRGDRAALGIVYLVSFVLWLASAFLLVRLLRHATSGPLSAMAVAVVAALYLFERQLNDLYFNGMETGLYCTLILLFLTVAQNHLARSSSAPEYGRAFQLGLVAGLLMLARNDAVFICGLVFLAILLFSPRSGRFVELAVGGLIASAMVLPWLVYCQWVAGTFVPQSGLATSAAIRDDSKPLETIWAIVLSLVPVYFVKFESFIAQFRVAVLVVASMCVTAMGVVVLRRGSPFVDQSTRLSILALAASAGCLLVYYPLVSSAFQFYDRYFAPLKMLVVILLALMVVVWMGREQLRTVVGLAASCVVVGAVASNLYWTSSDWRQHYIGYFGEPAYELARSPIFRDGSTIGMMETGRIGFMLPDRVTNLDGKMNVQALRALQQGRLEEEIRKARFDRILLHPFDVVFFDERAPGWRSLYVSSGALSTLEVFSRRPDAN